MKKIHCGTMQNCDPDAYLLACPTSLRPFCSGHGTRVRQDRLVATVCGIVDRVNKLITVRGLHHRYAAEVGDVVLGRVTEVRGFDI